MFSAEDLAQSMGQAWAPPRAASQGYVTVLAKPYGFAARIDVTGRIGWLTFHAEQPPFHGGFLPGVAIAGLNIGMTFEAARTARPGLEQIEAAPIFDIVRYADRTEDGARLFASFRKGLLTAITLEQEGRIYPAPLAPFEGQRPKTVYGAHLGADAMLPRRDRGTLWRQGWCHGLPPGLIAAQWPLSHQCGHPMRHAFTLRLPEEYRVKGP